MKGMLMQMNTISPTVAVMSSQNSFEVSPQTCHKYIKKGCCGQKGPHYQNEFWANKVAARQLFSAYFCVDTKYNMMKRKYTSSSLPLIG